MRTCLAVTNLRGEGNNKLGFDATKLKLPPHYSPPHYCNQRDAYVTIVVSSDKYVCGAISLACSIRKTGSTRDLILLHDESLSQAHLEALQTAGWALCQIESIGNPYSSHGALYEYTYSKFRIFQLTDYDKLVFIDCDICE